MLWHLNYFKWNWNYRVNKHWTDCISDCTLFSSYCWLGIYQWILVRVKAYSTASYNTSTFNFWQWKRGWVFKNKLVTTNCHLICFSIWDRLLSNISNLQLKSHISKSMQIFVNMNLYTPFNHLWCLSAIYNKLISLKSSTAFELKYIFLIMPKFVYDYRKCFRDSLQIASFEISGEVDCFM